MTDKLIVQMTPAGLVELHPFSGGVPTRIVTGRDNERLILHPWQITQLWSDAELAAIGLYRVEPVAPPADHVVVSYHFELQGEMVVQVIETAPLPPVIVESVTPAQGVMALYETGMLDTVEAAVAAHPYEPVRIYWHRALAWERDNPYMQALAMELGLSDEMMEQLFEQASHY
jgi:hypothetical protein